MDFRKKLAGVLALLSCSAFGVSPSVTANDGVAVPERLRNLSCSCKQGDQNCNCDPSACTGPNCSGNFANIISPVAGVSRIDAWAHAFDLGNGKDMGTWTTMFARDYMNWWADSNNEKLTPEEQTVLDAYESYVNKASKILDMKNPVSGISKEQALAYANENFSNGYDIVKYLQWWASSNNETLTDKDIEPYVNDALHVLSDNLDSTCNQLKMSEDVISRVFRSMDESEKLLKLESEVLEQTKNTLGSADKFLASANELQPLIKEILVSTKTIMAFVSSMLHIDVTAPTQGSEA